MRRLRRRSGTAGHDRPETVKHRLEVYHTETEPLKDFYAARDLLRAVPNAGSIEATTAAVMAALEMTV